MTKDWEVEVNAAVAKIGPVSGGELKNKTKNATQDLLGKMPDAGKIYLLQMMFSSYCTSIRDNKAISETEKAAQLKDFMSVVQQIMNPELSKSTAKPSNQVRSLTVRPPADLIISQLDSQERLRPLDGFKVLNVSNKSVYTGGCQVSFTLAHNRKGSETVSVHNIALHIGRFVEGANPVYAYEIDADQVHGLGPRKPNMFIARLNGNEVSHATWTGGDGKTQDVKADNLLPFVLDLTEAPNDDVQDIRGTLLLDKPGFYEVFFTFAYSVQGIEKPRKKSPVISLYLQQ